MFASLAQKTKVHMYRPYKQVSAYFRPRWNRKHVKKYKMQEIVKKFKLH